MISSPCITCISCALNISTCVFCRKIGGTLIGKLCENRRNIYESIHRRRIKEDGTRENKEGYKPDSSALGLPARWTTDQLCGGAKSALLHAHIKRAYYARWCDRPDWQIAECLTKLICHTEMFARESESSPLRGLPSYYLLHRSFNI